MWLSAEWVQTACSSSLHRAQRPATALKPKAADEQVEQERPSNLYKY